MLPCLLVLSYWERTATLISLEINTSIYALSKSIVDRLGTRPENIVRTKAEIEEAGVRLRELRRDSYAWDKQQRKMMLPYAEWQMQLTSLDRHIAMLENTFPDLVRPARSALAGLIAGETWDPELCDHLRALDSAANTRDFSPEDIPTRRIHKKLRRVVRKLETGDPLRPQPEPVNPHRGLLALVEARIELLNQLRRQQVSELQLSRVVQESVVDLYRTDKNEFPLRLQHLQGWTMMRVFRQQGRRDVPLRTART